MTSTIAPVTTASKLRTIKCEVYRLLGISPTAKNPTKEVKKHHGGYDMRFRDSWEIILLTLQADELVSAINRNSRVMAQELAILKRGISDLSAAVVDAFAVHPELVGAANNILPWGFRNWQAANNDD